MSCPQCSQGFILPGEPEGEITNVTSINAYLHRAPEGSTSTRAVFLFTDIFGLQLKNSKILADTFSKRLGCDVWVPDFFAGSPPLGIYDLEGIMPRKPGQTIPFFSYLKFAWLFLRRAFGFYRNRPAVVDARVKSFITKVKEDKKYSKVGAVGYCFGGSMCVRLSSKHLLDSIVIAHPGACPPELVQTIQIPSSWACAEDDMSFKPQVRQAAEAVLAGRKGKPNFTEYEFKDYKGTVHGFASRPHLEDAEAKAGFDGALDQTVAWFEKTLS
ncbi:dienelactone hydrolase endo-1,3,1,4-beta-D-glucanase [Neolentinus lepideus HHB14362 ss-1]|uniref:Dienelactone hydrolase endo-1,3,1,4-beta-D-glucanase n=1 Tax=Neolentinus lepideus HHB14362 ss-1 TaxID=1314782 RepID=A0A165NC27_9AGAM|nr:dienelactone hydrolase endo-1,3,1,4-beta-D-glucanase [Neolentinus lepideus HHB14362 ss-1]